MTAIVGSSPPTVLQFFDNRGNPAAGGSVLTQVGGVNYATYEDAAGTTPLPNPIPLNSRGEISNSSGVSCQLFLVSGVTYTFTLYDAALNQLNQATSVQTPDNLGTLAASSGSSLVGFIQSGTGAVATTAEADLQSRPVLITEFGTVDKTGATDCSAVAQLALTAANYVVFPQGGTYKVSSTLTLKTNQVLDFRGATIVANTSTNPLFVTTNKANSIHIYGGEVQGTASAFLKAIGNSDAPVSADFMQGLWIDGVYVSATTIGIFLWMNKAVREVFLNSCISFATNGILSDGKAVEIHGDKCLLWGNATAGDGSYGVKAISSGGTIYYNEGWHFSTCTIANYDKTIWLSDIFVFTLANGWLNACGVGSSAIYITDPTTTAACIDMKFNGLVVNDQIQFITGTGGDRRASFSDITCVGIAGANIDVGVNVGGINVSNIKFVDGTAGVSVGIVLEGNNSTVAIDGVTTTGYDAFVNAVQIKGTTSAIVSVRNVSHFGSAIGIYAESPYVGHGNVIQNSVDIASAVVTSPWIFQVADIAGTYATSAVMASITASLAQGETGFIDIRLPLSGMNATTQLFTLNLPTGMHAPVGTGWSDQYIYPSAVSCFLAVRIPYYCSAMILSGTISITNTAGNSAVVGSHSHFGIVRGW